MLQIAKKEVYEERTQITFTVEGQKVFGIMHRPLHKRKYPIIVMCHGLAGTKVGRRRLYVKMSQELAKQGIASLRFDFRGSGDSEGDILETTIEGEITDALAALDFVSNDPHVDTSRIGLLGRSLGGAIAVQAAKRYQHIKSIALWVPLFTTDNWKEAWEQLKKQPNEIPKIRDLEFFDGHLPNKDFLQQFFCMSLENDMHELLHIPLLHIHGEKDATINRSHVLLYSKTRSRAEALTRMLSFANADHDFSDPDEQEKIIAATTEWFQETL